MTGDRAIAYHRPVERSGARALVELVLAVVLWILGLAVVLGVATSSAGATKLEELDTLSYFVTAMTGMILLVPSCFIAARLTKRRPGMLSSTIGRLRWRWLLHCALLMIGVLAVAVVVMLVIAALLDDAPSGERAATANGAPFAHLAPAILLLVPLQSAGEEYLFRGTLVQTIGAWVRSPWVAIAISSLAFTALHMTEQAPSVALMVMGCLNAWLTIRTGGLEAAIAEHAVFNVVLLLASAADEGEPLSAQDPNANVTWSGAAFQIAVLFVYAALVLHRYRKRAPPAGPQSPEARSKR